MRTIILALLLTALTASAQFNFTDFAFSSPQEVVAGGGCTTYTVPQVGSLAASLVYAQNGGYEDYGNYDSYTFTVYAKMTVGGVTIYSSVGRTGTATETDVAPQLFYIYLNWAPVDGASGYRVVVDYDGFASWPVYFDTAANTTAVTIGNGSQPTWVDTISSFYINGTPTLTPTSTCQ